MTHSFRWFFYLGEDRWRVHPGSLLIITFLRWYATTLNHRDSNSSVITCSFFRQSLQWEAAVVGDKLCLPRFASHVSRRLSPFLRARFSFFTFIPFPLERFRRCESCLILSGRDNLNSLTMISKLCNYREIFSCFHKTLLIP